MKYDPKLNQEDDAPDPHPEPEPNPFSNSSETSLGIEENLAALLTYTLGWVTGVAFLLIEKENSFVRFHAMQSIVVFVPLMVLSWIVGIMPFIGFFSFIDDVLGPTLWIVTCFLWLFLMYQAFQGNRYKLPFAGDYAESQLKNTGSR